MKSPPRVLSSSGGSEGRVEEFLKAIHQKENYMEHETEAGGLKKAIQGQGSIYTCLCVYIYTTHIYIYKF